MSTKWNTEQNHHDRLSLIPEEEINALLVAFSHGVVAFDLETTGLSPLVDKIIEISAVKILPSGEVETFDELIDPQIPIPDYTTQIHGIDDATVKGAPNIEALGDDFLQFLDDKTLIAHNARFDAGFLVYDLHQAGLALPKSDVYCSCQLSRFIFKNFQGHGLGTLAEKLEIPLNHHRALNDAIACIRVFAKALIKQQEDEQKAEEQKRESGEKMKTSTLQAALKAGRLFSLADYKRDEDFEIPPHLSPIKDHLPTQKPLMIKYKGGSHRNIFRPIRPVSFLPLPDGDVLYAHCLISDLYKSFALKKIKDFRQVTDEDRQQWPLLKSSGSE